MHDYQTAYERLAPHDRRRIFTRHRHPMDVAVDVAIIVATAVSIGWAIFLWFIA